MMIIRRLMTTILALVCLVSISTAYGQTFRFDPDPYYPTDPQFTLPLLLESGGLDVKGVECSISFDTNLVSLDNITAGPWYTGSGQDFFFWDYTVPGTSTIHFASAMLDGTNNTDGAIAICHFTMVNFGSCDLIFTVADVRDVNNEPLSFALNNGLIVLDQAVDTDHLKFNALKAIYR